MRQCMDKLRNLLMAKTSNCIWVNTSETSKFVSDLIEMLKTSQDDNRIATESLLLWSCFSGLERYSFQLNQFTPIDEGRKKQTASPSGLLAYIQELQNKPSTENPIFIIKNFQLVNGKQPNITQAICDLKEFKSVNNIPVIVVSSDILITKEQEHLFTVFDYELPDENEIRTIIKMCADKINTKAKNDFDDQYDTITDDMIEKLVNVSKGLSATQIIDCCRKSIVEYKTLNLKMIKDEKIQIVKRSGCLDYREVLPDTFDNMGGNDNFKAWIKEAKETLDPQAKEFGIQPAKGYIAFGVPGSGC